MGIELLGNSVGRTLQLIVYSRVDSFKTARMFLGRINFALIEDIFFRWQSDASRRGKERLKSSHDKTEGT